MKFLYGAIAVVALLVVVAFVAPLLINWDGYKPEITRRIEEATGRQLWIDGDIDVAFLPTPKLRIADVRLSNVPGASVADMARLKALDLKLALGPLVGGDLQVTSLVLVDPVIELERLPDGQENWRFEPPAAEKGEGGQAAPGESEEPASEDERAVRLDAVEIRNGTIIYRDRTKDQVEFVQQLNAQFSVKSLEGPYRGEGSVNARGVDFAFRLATGSRREDSLMPVSAEIEVDEGAATVGFEGTVHGVDEAMAVDGTLRASGDNLATILTQMKAGPTKQAAVLAQAFSLKTVVSASQTGVTLDDLQLRLGETQGKGKLAVGFEEPMRIEAALALNRIDFDALEAEFGDVAAAPAPAEEEGGDEAPAEVAAAGGEPAVAEAGGATWLREDVVASINLSVDTVKYRDGVVRQAQAVLSMEEGVVTIQQASALLPGGADVSLFGYLAELEGAPYYEGRVEMVADDLRAVLAWLSVDPGNAPPDRLRRFSLTSDVVATETKAELTDLDVRLDVSRLAGTVSLAQGARTTVNADLKLDRLNADAYLAGAEPQTGAATSGAEPDTSAQAQDSGGESEEPAIAGLLSEGLPAELEEVDATVKATVGNLTYGGLTLNDAVLNGGLKDGILHVERLDVADVAGARLALKGELKTVEGKPKLAAEFDVGAKSVSRLMQVLEIDPAFRAESLGQVSLTGSLSGTRDNVEIDARLKTAPAAFSVDGGVAEPFGEPSLGLAFTFEAADAAQVLRIADIAPPETVRRLGAVALEGKLNGTLAALDLDLAAKAADASVKVAGHVAEALTKPAYDLTAEMAHPDFAALAERLMNKRLPPDKTGAMSVKGRLTGDASRLDIKDLAVALGETRVGGTAKAMLGGPVPEIEAELKAGLLDADIFLGGASGVARAEPRVRILAAADTANDAAPQRGAVGRSGRWSLEPMDLSVLNEMKAKLALDADTLLAGGYRLDALVLRLAVADGALDIETLKGRIFDGDLDAQGRLSGGAQAAATLSFELSNVDIAAALRQAADVKAATGRATITGEFATEGGSEHALVAGLNGEAKISGGDGTVEGVDLRAISNQLDSLNDITDFVSLAQTGLSGGTTPLESLDGTILVSDGFARTDDLKLVADGGAGTVRGSADLPGWQLDLTAMFSLTDHPEAPPLGVHLTGAIDAPERTLVTERMEAFLAERIAKAVVKKKVIPKLRKGASAEPGTPADVLLRGIFGDPDAADTPADGGGAAPSEAPSGQAGIPLPPLAPQRDERQPASTPAAPSEPPLAPQQDTTSPPPAAVPEPEPPLAPQVGETSPAPDEPAPAEPDVERAPMPEPVPDVEPAPRSEDEPLRPEDILRNLLDNF